MLRLGFIVYCKVRLIVFFELEDFVGMLPEVSCNLQGDDCRWHIATGLDEVDCLPRYADSVRQFLLGYILDGSFYLCARPLFGEAHTVHV